MTERHAGYLVVLELFIREDDAENILKALKMIKGVASVEALTSTPELQLAIAKAKSELKMKLWEIVE